MVMYANTAMVVVWMWTVSALAALEVPNPDPAQVQPLAAGSPPSTIPAFPEQSDLSGCPLDLSDDLFGAIDAACGSSHNRHLSKARCCPVLATWLYAAYSATSLARAARLPSASPYDLPILPDDSETCVDNLDKALRGRGIHLLRPNDTCDAVYCFCGIRLHVPSCTDAFSVASAGRLVADARVRRLERDCRAGPALRSCTNCLTSLHQLSSRSWARNASRADRKEKMHDKDCELMGVTWLLAKNTSEYAPTVSNVLRAIMMGVGRSCLAVTRDGMPLAVDSAELIDNPSSFSSPSSNALPFLLLLFQLLSHVHLLISFDFFSHL